MNWVEYLTELEYGDDRKKRYYKYLQSNEWETKREQRLSKDNYQCVNCKSKSLL